MISWVSVYPEGFKVTMQQPQDIEYLWLDASVNSELKEHECGTFSGFINGPDENGLFTYSNSHAKLELHNILYYKIILRKNSQLLSTSNRYYTVKKIKANPAMYRVTIPQVNIIVHRKGFRVSIPSKKGVEYFWFDANVNSELKEHECGTFSGCINRSNKRSVDLFRIGCKTKACDILYYRVIVRENGQLISSRKRSYTVTNNESNSAKLITIPQPRISEYRKDLRFPYQVKRV
ncbi:Beta-1,3-glucan-binding protein [Eumeta japonica]|uniref:Beta-1,3-glucan-binding protein n=1 Tax=Eumeta variegata TaxID=151549 RepID=A0A4C1ST60_EUMVA|nr:Beta-1,3-glucan-binding protein [Eumeta japonica]